ncbi:MAG: L-ribulose-5-phosphate 4-epimerase [Ruminococcus sp.]|nr:L-ribulose-5-phosphate 4-epimerase [Ruminococcus sp.]
MDVKELKERVLKANLMLPKYGLVTFTWGNVSEYDQETGLVAIKPSGVEYDNMTVNDIVVLTLDGKKVEGKLTPSSDTPTHLEIYRNFEGVRGVVHTHSRYATAFAQACMGIPPLGTTHGDYFYGKIPCTREMTDEEVKGDYELETGRVIVECCKDYNYIPAVLVANHGPFVWGSDCIEAVHNSVVLEELSAMAWITKTLRSDTEEMPKRLLDKHFFRKHGANAYYGQSK